MTSYTLPSNAQFSACPDDATSCCECVTIPGCIWSSVPTNNSTSRQSSCVPDVDFTSIVNELEVPSHLNRPFNPSRHRYLKPQSAQLKMSIGVRKEVPIQVLAQSRRLRLIIVGPNDFPEFSIEPGNDMSCSRRFRARERINERKNQKKINIDCHVSARGQSQKLNLIVDMNRCYQPMREIKLNIRERGSRRFKLQVSSSCECPCQQSTEVPEPESESEPEPNLQGIETCPENKVITQCVTQTDNTGEGGLCSGVNDYCRRDQNSPSCSGHGSCICGVCSCNYVPTEQAAGDSQRPPTIFLHPGMHQATPRHRYSGAYCQCNDFSCPHHNQQICGGSDRGMCQCGSCVCNEGYSGSACGSSSNTAGCLSPVDGTICGDRGDCNMGICQCPEGVFGAFCQDCPTCSNKCDMLAPCVECYAFDEVESNDAINCTAMCGSIEDPPITFMPSDGFWPDSADLCAMERNGCNYEFAYAWEEDGEMVVHYLNELHCYGDV